MLNLQRSKTRAAVARLLFEGPQEEWHVRGLAKVSGLSVGNVHRELARLLEEGYVEHRRDGRRVLYRANKSHPLYEEMQSIVAKTIGLRALLKAALPDVAQLRWAALLSKMPADAPTPAPAPGPRRSLARADLMEEALRIDSAAADVDWAALHIDSPMGLAAAARQSAARAAEEIELVLVGRPALTDLDEVLAGVGNACGRPVKWVLFDEDEVRHRLRHRDPFVLALLGRPRTMLLGGEAEARAMLRSAGL